MFLKVTAGHHPYGQRGDFLIEVEPPIYFDYAALKLGKDAEWEDVSWESENGMTGGIDKRLVSVGDVDWGDAMGAEPSYLHMLEFTADQTQYEANHDMVAFRYVWWHSDKGIEAVVTTRNIFIMSDTGATIDKV